jgi:SAM-dependent methyltransferase
MAIEHRFGPEKAAYVAFRPGYPDSLFQQITDALDAPRLKAIDLGAGTGLSTAPLCSRFEDVVAVEPDPEMAEELRRAAPAARVLEVPAEEFPESLGPVDLVTAANAFYWMDGPVVSEKVARTLRPGGRFAVYRHRVPEFSPALQDIFTYEMDNHWGQFRHKRLVDEEYSFRVIESCGHFQHVKRQVLSQQISFEASKLVGYLRSTSFGSAYVRTLSDPEAYLVDLGQRLRTAAGGSPFPMNVRIELILARK